MGPFIHGIVVGFLAVASILLFEPVIGLWALPVSTGIVILGHLDFRRTFLN